MGIDKYKKSTPDFTIDNTAQYSTDNSNLRCYKISNVSMADNNLEYCFSTNFNYTEHNDNTYVNVVTDSTTSKTGVNTLGYRRDPQTNYEYVQLDKSGITWDKINGIAYAVLFQGNMGYGVYDDIYIMENLNYDKIVLGAAGWNAPLNKYTYLDDDGDTPVTDTYGFDVRFDTGSTYKQIQIANGAIIVVKLYKYNGAICGRILSAGANYLREIMLNRRGPYDPHPDSVNAECPYMTNLQFNCVLGLLHNTNNTEFMSMFTLPYTDETLWREVQGFGGVYLDFIFGSVNVDGFIKYLNSIGLRYYDRGKYTSYTDMKANTYIGVMDKNGITDCNNRIKGADNINASDLPNAHRTGYDWDVVDPTKPPTPEPSDDDEIDDMKLGVGRNYAGMVKYYRLDPAQLLLFSQEIQKSSVVPEGYDIMRNIIALKRFPVNLNTYAEFSEPDLIKLGSVTIPLSASQLDGEKKNIGIGKYTIQGYHGTKENPHFLDFSPYTTAEVFIPYCGFVTIPTDKIMYNEIEVRLLVDVKLGNCTGVVKCNGNIVGQKAGTLGADIPLVAVNMGVAMGAITQGLMDTTLGFVSAIPYAAAGNVAATFSGVLNGASALTQTIMSSKKNYTEVIGTTGGDIMFTMPDRCYIKLTYPKKDLPINYGKMVGYMCGKGGRLGDFSGFTICENVHVNVKATEEEKQMILEKLLTGVIMPYNS